MLTEHSNPPIEQKLENAPIEGLNPLGFFNESTSKGSCSVKVVVRVRPLLPKEINAEDGSCVQINTSNNTVVVGVDKRFSFDKVFGTDSTQQEVFDVCVKNLVLSSFAGYNSTVLAYGQTCSGKTFTMGTEVAWNKTKEQQGIIPKVVGMIFDEVDKRKTTKEFIIKVSFIEIYNEEIYDLLDPQGQSKITIRELTRGIPSLCGQQEERVLDSKELFHLLEKGAIHRRTRSTLMNESSSRSHAILEINIEQHLIEDLYQNTSADAISPTHSGSNQEFVTAKFHFVDLAGSERIKKTGAEGESLQEGISINKALFVLGKVINALIEEGGKNSYKPYRESSLTRILQNSLGGNARTTMIACISPAESSQEETLSTLLYACKARSIRNKPVVNTDPSSTMIRQLQQQVFDLQRELSRFRRTNTMPLPLPLLGEAYINVPEEQDMKAKMAALRRENDQLKETIKCMEDQKRKKEIEFLEIQKQRDILKLHNERLKSALGNTVCNEPNEEELNIVTQYRDKVSTLEAGNSKLLENITVLQSKYEEECKNANIQNGQMLKLNQELQRLKRTLAKLRREEGRTINSYTIKHSEKEELTSVSWLSPDFTEQLKEVNNNFINELAQSLGTLVTDMPKSDADMVSEPSNSNKLTPNTMKNAANMTGKENAIEEIRGAFDIYKKSTPKGEANRTFRTLSIFGTYSEPRAKNSSNELIEEQKESVDSISEQNITLKDPENTIIQELASREEIDYIDECQVKQENVVEAEIKNTLTKVEGDIHEREKMLEQIKEKHKDMQKNLLAIMENQYHKKLEELEYEMEKFKSEQEKAVQCAPKDNMGVLELQYKKKLTEYETRIKEYKKHQVNQQKLLKQTDMQEGKIQTLTEEILNMKQQKMELMGQIKKEREGYEKNRKEQVKQALKLKQETIKQKIIITRLTNEKERHLKAKKVELTRNNLAITKEQLMDYRSLVENFSSRLTSMKQEMEQVQKEEQKQKEINSKLNDEYDALYKLKLKSEKLAITKKELDPVKDYDKVKETEEALEGIQRLIVEQQMNIENLEDTLRYHEQKAVKLLKTKAAIKTQLLTLLGKSKVRSPKELNELITVLFEMLSEEKIKRNSESIKLKADQNIIASLSENIQDLVHANKVLKEEFEAELTKLKAAFEARETAFKSEKDLLVKTCKDKPEVRGMDIISGSRRSVDSSRGKTELAKDDKGSAIFLKRELEDCKKRNMDIMKENSQLRNQIIGLTGENEKLSKNSITLSRKMDGLTSKLKTKNEKQNTGLATPKILSLHEQRLSRKQRIVNERLAHSSCDPKNKNVNSLIMMPAKKNETSKTKYQMKAYEYEKTSLTKMNADGQLSVTDLSTTIKATREDYSRKVINSSRGKNVTEENTSYIQSTKERSSFITTANKLKSNVIKESLSVSSQCMSSQVSTESSKWKCVYNEEQHSFGIFSLAAFEHYLISSSNVLKLWDINKRTTHAEIPVTNPKVLHVYDKMLISTSEKQGSVVLYSLPNLEVIQTIETGLDAVRAIHVDKNIAFLGGSGSIGALQLWDLNTMTRLCEKERGQDIFSILYKNSVIYYGGRNRCVNRVNFETMVFYLNVRRSQCKR